MVVSKLTYRSLLLESHIMITPFHNKDIVFIANNINFNHFFGILGRYINMPIFRETRKLFVAHNKISSTSIKNHQTFASNYILHCVIYIIQCVMHITHCVLYIMHCVIEFFPQCAQFFTEFLTSFLSTYKQFMQKTYYHQECHTEG